MAEIVVAGGGICGLNAAMLLAGDGHTVTVLERDPEPPPATAEQAWAGWERKGVNQFRLPHFFLARFRILLEAELPGVLPALDAAGALRTNPIAEAPEFVTGGPRPGDEEFWSVTGRRPVMEAIIATVAAGTPGLTVRRGVTVTSLVTSGPARSGVPHVSGVRTGDGQEFPADLVVDATGRRSTLPRLLEAIGGRPPAEDLDDCGFVYYGRTFRSQDGALPPAFGPPLQHYGSVSTLTLPADNGTWAFAFITRARDTTLRSLREPDAWARAAASFPLVAHWASGEPLESDVLAMAGIEDRSRRYVLDGVPVATGVVPLADSWACSNPSVGRGASIGLLHAVALRDLVRDGPLDDPLAFALAWDEATESVAAPWYQETLWADRHRLGEIDAILAGQPYEPHDHRYELLKALGFGATVDPELLRLSVRNALLLSTLDEIIEQVGADRLLAVGGGWREAPLAGPDRNELVKVLTA
jgi:2-polyprenyl-6-methoxyphenol hydroxylase-like FAD-dependent oxidoreductase